MFEPRITLQQQVAEQLKSHFGARCRPVTRATCVWPRRRATACRVVVFDPSAKGSLAFVESARETVDRIEAM